MSSNTLENSRLVKIINYIVLLFTAGSCFFVLSVISTRDTYFEILQNSTNEGSINALNLAKNVLNMPMFILIIIFIIILVGKEFAIKSSFRKLALNLASAVVFSSLCVFIFNIISHPLT